MKLTTTVMGLLWTAIKVNKQEQSLILPKFSSSPLQHLIRLLSLKRALQHSVCFIYFSKSLYLLILGKVDTILMCSNVMAGIGVIGDLYQSSSDIGITTKIYCDVLQCWYDSNNLTQKQQNIHTEEKITSTRFAKLWLGKCFVVSICAKHLWLSPYWILLVVQLTNCFSIWMYNLYKFYCLLR